jgi:hypothetical protein
MGLEYAVDHLLRPESTRSRSEGPPLVRRMLAQIRPRLEPLRASRETYRPRSAHATCFAGYCSQEHGGPAHPNESPWLHSQPAQDIPKVAMSSSDATLTERGKT